MSSSLPSHSTRVGANDRAIISPALTLCHPLLSSYNLPYHSCYQFIGEFIDFKFESDYVNETAQRPRLNMVAVALAC